MDGEFTVTRPLNCVTVRENGSSVYNAAMARLYAILQFETQIAKTYLNFCRPSLEKQFSSFALFQNAQQ